MFSGRLALTPALSPGERERFWAVLEDSNVLLAFVAWFGLRSKSASSPTGVVFQERGERFSLSPGERAGVRASFQTVLESSIAWVAFVTFSLSRG